MKHRQTWVECLECGRVIVWTLFREAPIEKITKKINRHYARRHPE